MTFDYEANCPVKGNDIFSKSVRLTEPQPGASAF